MSEENKNKVYYVKEGKSIIIGRTIHGPGKKVPANFIKENPERTQWLINSNTIEEKKENERPTFDNSIPEEKKIKKAIEVKKTSLTDLKKEQEKNKDAKKESKEKAKK